jgi:cytochrome c553
VEDIAAYVSGQRSGSSGGPVSGNAAAGKSKADTCGACHGADGQSAAGNVPILAGQLEGYLVKALKDYRTGKRTNPVMNGMAAPLSEQDLVDISAYYASQAKGLVTISD